jgi:hypothetical protein
MHHGEPYGHLATNGVPISIKELAQRLQLGDKRGTERVTKCLQELLTFGVVSQTKSGVLFSRRMVRDESIRLINRANGMKGGNPYIKNSVNPPVNPPVNPDVDVRDREKTLEAPRPTRRQKKPNTDSPANPGRNVKANKLPEPLPAIDFSKIKPDQLEWVKKLFANTPEYLRDPVLMAVDSHTGDLAIAAFSRKMSARYKNIYVGESIRKYAKYELSKGKRYGMRGRLARWENWIRIDAQAGNNRFVTPEHAPKISMNEIDATVSSLVDMVAAGAKMM